MSKDARAHKHTYIHRGPKSPIAMFGHELGFIAEYIFNFDHSSTLNRAIANQAGAIGPRDEGHPALSC